MNKTKFFPVAMFPLPMAHGLTVFLMTVTGLVALFFLSQLFTAQRSIF